MQDPPSLTNDFHREHAHLLMTSFRHWTDKSLLNADESGRELFYAPFVVVSHDTAEDPIFNYGNQCALDLFEMSWEDFTRMPSRKSAEPMNREERARLLDLVARQEYIDDYAGVRISASGKRFFIPQATVWNVIDRQGFRIGQAATFSQWEFL